MTRPGERIAKRRRCKSKIGAVCTTPAEPSYPVLILCAVPQDQPDRDHQVVQEPIRGHCQVDGMNSRRGVDDFSTTTKHIWSGRLWTQGVQVCNYKKITDSFFRPINGARLARLERVSQITYTMEASLG
jgi:hypothetical protein